MADDIRITITKDGPYEVTGAPPFHEQSIAVNERAESLEWAQTGTFESKPEVTLCRCGKSGNKPFCDGTHVKTDWSDKD